MAAAATTRTPAYEEELGPLVSRLEQVLRELEETTAELRGYYQSRARRIGLPDEEGGETAGGAKGQG